MRVARALAFVLVFVLVLPSAAAESSGQARATLKIDVRLDHGEQMTLAFEGLHRLTQYEGICLPERARESHVYDDLGDVAYNGQDQDGRRVLSFTARSDKLYVDMARGPAAGQSDAPVISGDVNFCVPQATSTRVEISLPADHTLFFLSDNGTITDPRNGTATSDGPSQVFYSYEAPIPRSLEAFDEGPFRVFVDPSLATAARRVAANATAPFQAALREAGLTVPFGGKVRIVYAETTPFAWEAGHYNGRGFVQVKTSSLDGDPTTGFPYSAVKLLVHESFHAASFPYGQGPVAEKIAWFLEGSARHAERQVDLTMPNASIYCEKATTQVKCWSFDDRITRAELDAGYQPSFTFDPRWEPSLPQSDDARRFYYGFSEFAIGAWIEQNGVGNYQNVWRTIEKAFDDGTGCPCGDGWLEGILHDSKIFAPWSDVRASDPAGFDARVKPFLKDEAALQHALDSNAGPLAGLKLPFPPVLAILAVAMAVVVFSRKRR